MSNDLLIKINADAANATKAFDDIREKTDDLESNLKDVALISGAAFAALTAEIFFSVKAFEEAQIRSVSLSTALQNQGIYTDDLKASYESYAKAIQASTGVNDDQIIKAQAVAQGFIGQRKITLDLTQAIVDLGAEMGGDLNAAAEKIGRTIGTGTNAFARQGLVISATATSAERYSQVLDFVKTKAGGLAEAFNVADGGAKALATSVDKFQEAIGARFAPVVEGARKAAIGLFQAFTDHPFLADLVAAAIAAGAAVTGLTAAIAVGIPIFLALSAAALTFGVAVGSLLLIPTAVAAIVAGVTLLALNWDKSLAAVKAATSAAVGLITDLFHGLGTILSGFAFGINPDKIREGLNQIGAAFVKSKNDTIATYTAITAASVGESQKQLADKAALADKLAAVERQHQANLVAIRQGEVDLLRLQNEHASADIITLKQKEIETLKALDSQKNKTDISLLQARLAEVKSLEADQQKEDVDRAKTTATLLNETRQELQQQGINVDAQIQAQRLAAIRATAKTEVDIERDLQDQILTKKIAARNQELLDRKKYGAAVAILNKTLNSDEVQGAESAVGELVQLEQSKNATLKAIGKVAAVADITVKTAQSAMNIYEGFSTIPIIGPVLGIAGAAAAVAFGAERISAVTAAADGGLLTGGIPGRDSIPVLGMPGELVVPTKNFDEVVGSVQDSRSGDSSDPNSAAILQTLQEILQKTQAPQQTVIQGDVLTDDSYVDALVRKISNAVEFRNGKIFGLNI